MKVLSSIFLIFFSALNLWAGDIEVKDIGSYKIGNNPNINFWKSNETDKYKIISIRTSDGIVIKNSTDAGGALNIDFGLSSIQNLKFDGAAFILVENNNNRFTIPIHISAEAHYNDNYDAYTYNISGTTLIDSLRNRMNAAYVSYTYKAAREKMFGYIDNYDGYVECFYTGRKLETTTIPDVNTQHFNTEHTWAQTYGAETEPEKSDIFHLRPTYEPANSARANFPFGYVVSNITYSDSGCALGTGNKGETVFEVRDKVKGDVARSMFYFALKYGNKSSVKIDFLKKQYDDLYNWYYFDPVDETEMQRNNRIEESQMIRNPFIDHPEFIDRMNLIGDYTIHELFLEADTIIKFTNDTEHSAYFFSNTDLKLEYAELSGNNSDDYKITVADSILKANSVFAVDITHKFPASFGNAVLKVKFKGKKESLINLYSYEYNSIDDIKNNEGITVYPNPNSSNRINIRINNTNLINSFYTVEIHTINGQEVYKNSDFLVTDNLLLPLDNVFISEKEYIISLNINGKKYFEKVILK